MSGNSFGKFFKITNFGESHGKYIGVVIDGCPPGLEVSEKYIQKELDKRKPGQSDIATTRKEQDEVEIISGIFNGHTTGASLCMLVKNKDIDSTYYENIKFTPRPGHADYTAYVKYNGFNDYRGGGIFSGRITVGFVMAGAVAKKLLKLLKIEVIAHTVEIAGIKSKEVNFDEIRKNINKNVVKTGDSKIAEKMIKKIKEISKEGNSVGGIIEGIVLNTPIGLGEPVFDSLESDISKALFSIPGVKGVEFGSGFKGTKLKGSENNDDFTIKDNQIITKTNNSGGILGGISNGMPIICRVAVKPTPSISKLQKTIDLRKMKETELKIKGRYDPCIVPRAVPVVESMIAVVLADHLIRSGIIPKNLSKL